MCLHQKSLVIPFRIAHNVQSKHRFSFGPAFGFWTYFVFPE
jgi:hypothetical protein